MKSSLAAVLAVAGFAAARSHVSCPTATVTERCSTCAVPFCIPLEPFTVPCGCQTSTVPKVTVSLACDGPSPCAGGCVSTDYSIVPAPCSATPTTVPTTTTTSYSITLPPTHSPTTIPSQPSCPTITSTVYDLSCSVSGSKTVTASETECIVAECILEDVVTVPCDCVSELPLTTSTVTECGCRRGCGVATSLEFLPCPESPPPEPTSTA